MAATRTRCTLCRMCGRIWPGGILPSTPWPTMKKRALWTPLAGRPTCKAASYGRWVCPASGSPRTRCASCGCTASQPGLALPSTRPRRRRHRSCVPIWTAYRWSASRKSLQNCWPHPPLRHILIKKYCLLFCRSFHRRHWRRQSRWWMPARRVQKTCPSGWRRCC